MNAQRALMLPEAVVWNQYITTSRQFLDCFDHSLLDLSLSRSPMLGGDETRSGYVRYVQGIQPSIPACTMFIEIYTILT